MRDGKKESVFDTISGEAKNRIGRFNADGILDLVSVVNIRKNYRNKEITSIEK